MNVSELNEQLKTGKVFVDFWAPWCGPCKSIHKSIDELEGENTDIKFIRFNVDEDTEGAKELGIKSIPTLRVYLNGSLVEEKIGAAPKNVLNGMIDKIK